MQRTMNKSGAKTALAVAILICFGLRAFAGDSSTPSFKLSEVLPVGQREIELMAVQFSPRHAELSQKMQGSLATNKDWLLDQIKRAKPGQPLDYDIRIGLSKDEYAEYLKEG